MGWCVHGRLVRGWAGGRVSASRSLFRRARVPTPVKAGCGLACVGACAHNAAAGGARDAPPSLPLRIPTAFRHCARPQVLAPEKPDVTSTNASPSSRTSVGDTTLTASTTCGVVPCTIAWAVTCGSATINKAGNPVVVSFGGAFASGDFSLSVGGQSCSAVATITDALGQTDSATTTAFSVRQWVKVG